SRRGSASTTGKYLVGSDSPTESPHRILAPPTRGCVGATRRQVTRRASIATRPRLASLKPPSGRRSLYFEEADDQTDDDGGIRADGAWPPSLDARRTSRQRWDFPRPYFSRPPNDDQSGYEPRRTHT